MQYIHREACYFVSRISSNSGKCADRHARSCIYTFLSNHTFGKVEFFRCINVPATIKKTVFAELKLYFFPRLLTSGSFAPASLSVQALDLEVLAIVIGCVSEIKV